MKTAGLFPVLLLAACASHSGVVSIGGDAFMISKQAATGFSGLGNLKAELLAEAGAHCQTLGKVPQITHTQESQPPYILGNFPRAEIQYRCVNKTEQMK